jgi:GT2 family glycosyltransferase
MTKKLTVSVVIPCHDNAESLELVLCSLRAQSAVPEEIICVNDASSAQQVRELLILTRSFGARLSHLPRSELRLGRRSMARNFGSRLAHGEVILYLDGDMVLGPDYVRTLRLVHAADPRAVVKGIRYFIPMAAQSRGTSHCLSLAFESRPVSHGSLDLYSSATQTPAGSLALRLDRLLFRSARPIRAERSFALRVKSNLRTSGAATTFAVDGNNLTYSDRWECCASNNLSVRRREVHRIRYWDESFVGWGEEDMDFAYRLYSHGCRPVLALDGALCAYHLDHEIDTEANLRSLDRNARYLVRKFPRMACYRRAVYSSYGLAIEPNRSEGRKGLCLNLSKSC